MAPDRPEVYLELALAVERESGLDAAREVLDKGLATAPKAIDLYLALANLEQRAGRVDRAIDALELGLKAMPDEINLRVQLALLLANRGDTGHLLTPGHRAGEDGREPPIHPVFDGLLSFQQA